MKQIKYILFTTLLSMVLISNSYSQRNWDQRSYPVYPIAEEWIIAVNGGLCASNHFTQQKCRKCFRNLVNTKRNLTLFSIIQKLLSQLSINKKRFYHPHVFC